MQSDLDKKLVRGDSANSVEDPQRKNEVISEIHVSNMETIIKLY